MKEAPRCQSQKGSAERRRAGGGPRPATFLNPSASKSLSPPGWRCLVPPAPVLRVTQAGNAQPSLGTAGKSQPQHSKCCPTSASALGSPSQHHSITRIPASSTHTPGLRSPTSIITTSPGWEACLGPSHSQHHPGLACHHLTPFPSESSAQTTSPPFNCQPRTRCGSLTLP